jgi:hypothetical protein
VLLREFLGIQDLVLQAVPQVAAEADGPVVEAEALDLPERLGR